MPGLETMGLILLNMLSISATLEVSQPEISPLKAVAKANM